MPKLWCSVLHTCYKSSKPVLGLGRSSFRGTHYGLCLTKI
jgi:hypothetical protein